MRQNDSSMNEGDAEATRNPLDGDADAPDETSHPTTKDRRVKKADPLRRDLDGPGSSGGYCGGPLRIASEARRQCRPKVAR